jgi:hypothetical protein
MKNNYEKIEEAFTDVVCYIYEVSKYVSVINVALLL